MRHVTFSTDRIRRKEGKIRDLKTEDRSSNKYIITSDKEF